MPTEDDRASDRRMVVSVAIMMALVVAAAWLADAGTIGPVWWLVLTLAAIGAVAVLAAWLQRRGRSGR